MTLPYETKPGDVDHLIADDHAVVNRRFEQLEAGMGDRRTLVDQIIFELSAHAAGEEKVVYPVMASSGDEGLAAEARDEHRRMKEALAVLDDKDPGDPEFEQALRELMTEVRSHVQEEEQQWLARLRQAVGPEKMAELGEKFLTAKADAPSRPHPKAPDTSPANKIIGAGAALVDKARDKASGRMKRLATDASGLLNPQAQEILDAFAALEPLPIEVLPPKVARKQPTPADAARRVLEQRGQSTEPEEVGSVEDRSIPGPGGDIPIRVYRPRGAIEGAALPVVVYVHGGGWVIADLDVYDATPRGLANKAQAVVVSVEYRQAPEHPFPAAHDDVLAATRWVTANAADIGGDPSRVAIAGESAGGNLAASTTLQMLAAGEPSPVAQVLVYPVVTGSQDSPSFLDAADARPLNRPMMSWFSHWTFKDSELAPTDPRFELLGRPTHQLAALPPTLVVTAERDPLRSQGGQFAERLREAGVAVQHLAVDGVTHEFFGMSAVLDAAEEAQQRAADLLLRCFAGTTGRHVVDLRAGQQADARASEA